MAQEIVQDAKLSRIFDLLRWIFIESDGAGFRGTSGLAGKGGEGVVEPSRWEACGAAETDNAKRWAQPD